MNDSPSGRDARRDSTQDIEKNLLDGKGRVRSLLHELRRNEVFIQGSRYVAVGVSSALIELALFCFLFMILHAPVLTSNIIALTVATIYNFTMSFTWTFKATSSLQRSIVLYLTLFIWNQVFSSWTIVALYEIGLPAVPAKLLTMAAIVLWNFILYRKVIFK